MLSCAAFLVSLLSNTEDIAAYIKNAQQYTRGEDAVLLRFGSSLFALAQSSQKK